MTRNAQSVRLGGALASMLNLRLIHGLNCRPSRSFLAVGRLARFLPFLCAPRPVSARTSDANERRNAVRGVAGGGRGRAGDARAAVSRATCTAVPRRRAGGRSGGAVRAAASPSARRLRRAGGGAARGARSLSAPLPTRFGYAAPFSDAGALRAAADPRSLSVRTWRAAAAAAARRRTLRCACHRPRLTETLISPF